MVPIHAAGSGDHEALLNDFLAAQDEWEKWRTWSDETTHAVHESLTLRAEFVHEADPDDIVWTIAAYESPVGERRWHATATATTPVAIMCILLDPLASGDAAQTAVGSQVSEKTITQATQPLTDAGWEHTVDGRWVRWHAPGEHAPASSSTPSAPSGPTVRCPPGQSGAAPPSTSPPGPSASRPTPRPPYCRT
ncbi:DUF317 domain-containing protein [Streptomyces violascens]|uniref:DUF317 domain-containing protein n=1 Tax=Streptomyces violascens TaxID=67381 RepID=UPI001679BD42|nr:DUF317 domain-containing protein [Streptomyces violascens]GGU41532.1 hypothetical protein GCM10010289_73090 [Streptomyces violascens]